MSEKRIEKAVCEYARVMGWIVIKMDGPGKRGIPDDLLLHKKGVALWLEFKDEGKPLDPLQLHWRDLLEQMGFDVRTVDDEQMGFEIIDDFTP